MQLGTQTKDARTNAWHVLVVWAMYDWAVGAFSVLIQTFVFASYFTQQVASNPTIGTTLWGNTLSAVALIIGVGGPVLGAIADQSGHRKPWIAAFTMATVTTTGCLWFVEPESSDVFLGLTLLGIASITQEFAAIFYNSMLPALAPKNQIGRWSGWGWSSAYLGGVVCLLVALIFFVQPHAWIPLERESSSHVRATFLLVAVWLAVFSLPFFVFCPDHVRTRKPLRRAVGDGFAQLVQSIKQVRRYLPLLRFFVARMIYTDGLVTMFAFAGVFSAGTFELTPSQIVLFGMTLNITAGLGAIAFAWVDDWLGGKRTIVLSLLALMLLVAFMLLARTLVVFWTVALISGLFVGPAQSASRSYLSRVAPESLRSQMFGLYALSGRATAFLGPLLVGWVTFITESQRWGLSIIVLLLFIGALIMMGVPEDKHHGEDE